MSRAYNAKRKAKRQQARAAAEPPERPGPARSRRLIALVPILVIAAVLVATAVLGFGSGNGINQKQVKEEVTELLADIPQKGATLGSPGAPITLWIYADLECPTVKLFVESYLPSIIDTWVRNGDVKLEYRSLETDTSKERTFFEQEIAALAAGRQDRMWNFLLTFVHEQQLANTGYVTEEFLAGIASQVPGLKRAQWRQDRDDALLSRRVALGVHSAHQKGFSYTPSFLLGITRGELDRGIGRSDKASLRREVEESLREDIVNLREGASRDIPSLGVLGVEGG